MLCAPTPTAAIAPPVVSALSFVSQYLEDDFQWILSYVLDSRLFASLSASAPAPQQYKSPCERLLKDRFRDIYWGKTYFEDYNFFQ